MHYKDGTEAKAGDTVKFTDHSGEQVAVLTELNPAATTCNAMAQRIVMKPTFVDAWVTIGDCELVHRKEEVLVNG